MCVFFYIWKRCFITSKITNFTCLQLLYFGFSTSLLFCIQFSLPFILSNFFASSFVIVCDYEKWWREGIIEKEVVGGGMERIIYLIHTFRIIQWLHYCCFYLRYFTLLTYNHSSHNSSSFLLLFFVFLLPISFDYKVK